MDASRIPIVSAEWLTSVRALTFEVEGLGRPMFMQDIPSWFEGERVCKAMGVTLSPGSKPPEPLLEVVQLTVPIPIEVEAVSWSRARKTLYLMTDIVDNRDDYRQFTISNLSTDDDALDAVRALRVSLPLIIDEAKSMHDAVAELHARGRTEKEIMEETGLDSQTVREQIEAFKKVVASHFEAMRLERNGSG